MIRFFILLFKALDFTQIKNLWIWAKHHVKKLIETNENFNLYKQEADKWKLESKKFLDEFGIILE